MIRGVVLRYLESLVMGELGECPSSLDEEEQRGRDLTAQLYLC